MPLTIADIKKLLSGRSAGTWVHGTDLLGKKSGRPYLLLRDPTAMRPIQCLGRSSTPMGGDDERAHRAHAAGHAARCFIDRDGAIVLRPLMIRADDMDNVGCDEPDDRLMAQLLWRYVP